MLPIRVLPLSWPAALLWLAAAGAASAEPAPPAAPAEGIAGAKRDFEAVKSTRDGVSDKGAAPRIGLPEMQTETPSYAPRPQQKRAGSDRKSANWLVDAMEKSDPRRQSARDKTDADGTDPLVEQTAESGDRLTTEAAATAGEARRDDKSEAGRHARATVINPLDRYLGDWMTPQDYAVLQPALVAGARLPGESVAPPAIAGLAAVPGLDAAGPDFKIPGASTPAIAAPPPRENPFLQALSASAPSLPAPAVVNTAPPPPAGVPPLLAPAPAAPASPASPVPEFARPNASLDDKYFKPMKRF